MLKMSTTYYQSPIGPIEIRASENAVTSVIFCDECRYETNGGSEITEECARQLDEYFNGKRLIFDVPVEQEGTTFQQSVWNTLTSIPFGETVCYADVAKMLGNPQSVRAVGAANGQNKIWIIVPCHRVIGSDGSLTGYAGGVECKRWLLAHEAKVSKKRNGTKTGACPTQLELF